jgi:hypothetical protein
MLALLLTAAAAGYALRQHSDICQEDGMLEVHLNFGAFWEDICRAWAIFATFCGWVIATARACRHYCNAILIPWLAGYGVCVPLVPALMLPRSPESLIDFDALDARITEDLPKSIA